jgi:hypothetical protein
VRTSVEAQTWATFINRAGRAEYSAHLVGWGSNPDGSHPMRNIIATVDPQRGWGASNRGRYSNPELDAALLASLSELDEAKRRELLYRVQRITAEDLPVLVLAYKQNMTFAQRRVRNHSTRPSARTNSRPTTTLERQPFPVPDPCVAVPTAPATVRLSARPRRSSPKVRPSPHPGRPHHQQPGLRVLQHRMPRPLPAEPALFDPAVGLRVHPERRRLVMHQGAHLQACGWWSPAWIRRGWWRPR